MLLPGRVREPCSSADRAISAEARSVVAPISDADSPASRRSRVFPVPASASTNAVAGAPSVRTRRH